MKALANQPTTNLRPIQYWWLWVLDTVLVSAGVLFFLATRYGTYEFFGKACAMAVLPSIPVLVLVGGAGSTVFALTKVMIQKRSLNRVAALVLLVGPALVVTSLLVLVGGGRSPAYRLAYICAGHVPGPVSQVQVTGYSTFLREEWLAVFQTDEKAFQSMVAGAKWEAVPATEFNRQLAQSSLNTTRTFQSLPPSDAALCFKRVFQGIRDRERGTLYAVYYPDTATAAVFRQHHD